ncbi:tyrosine-type recombinase/integrase [Yeosuana sp. AK3]
MIKKKKVNLKDLNPNQHSKPSEGDCCENKKDKSWKIYLPAIISFAMLIIGITLDYFDVPFFKDWVRIVWYSVAYLPVGLPVIKEGWESIKKGDVFTEFFLMSIATIGAFVIGEYPEGVAVMLFYAVGELFQNAAVNRAKGNIKALLDVRPKEAKRILEVYKDYPCEQNTHQLLPVLSSQKVNKHLKNIAELCGIDKKLTFHVARHTFATTITLLNNVPLVTVSNLLSHKKISTTQKYARVG